MKKKEKIVILALVIITVILLVILIVRNASSNSTEDVIETVSDTEVTSESGYVTLLSDGTRLNTSEKLNEDKTLEGIAITDIQLTESDNVTQLLATMTNTSDETEGGYIATVTLIDEDGETLISMKSYIAELDPGESTQLNTSAVFDYADAYDFTITR